VRCKENLVPYSGNCIQIVHNSWCYPCSNCYKIDHNMQFWIWCPLWHHLKPQRKTTIWVHNYSPSRAQQSKRYLGKFTCCMTFGAHKLVLSAIFGMHNQCKLRQLLPALYCNVYKKKFMQVHINVLGPKVYQWNFIKIPLVSVWSSAHIIFHWFLEFSQFSTATSAKLWRHLATETAIL